MAEPIPPADLLEHAAFVRRLAVQLLADGPDADDSAQEAIARTIERPPAPHPAGVRPWLATVLRNLIHTGRRSTRRRGERERIAARPESVTAAGDLVARDEILRLVGDAVRSLDATSREVVLLRHYEDLPPRAIAARLSIPVETVHSRLRRGHERLRARLDEERGGNVEGWRSALGVLVGVSVIGAAASSAAAASAEGAVLMGTSSKIALAVAAAVLLAGGVFLLAPKAGARAGDPHSDPRDAATTPVMENPTSPTLAVASRTTPPAAPPPIAAGSREEAAPEAPPVTAPEATVHIPWSELADLENTDPVIQSEALARLRARLEAATQDPTQRDTDGTSKVRVVLEPYATSRWKHVQWVMQTLTDPRVRVNRLQFASPGGGAGIDEDLPRDRGPDRHPIDPAAQASDPPSVRVALFRLDADDPAKASTKIKVAGTDLLVASASTPEVRAESWTRLRDQLAGLRAADARLTAVIDAPPPKGWVVPYADVFEVLTAVRAAGIAVVLFQGAPGPLPPSSQPR